MATSERVCVGIYDVTKGLAAQMSQALIGRRLDGVWHTCILVYGNEYLYGSHGVSFGPPGDTPLGAPDETVDLGETEIPLELFHEYLVELGSERFRGERYHLMDHNCNNFSDEVAQFLTGSRIPAKVTGLPADVMSTPLGQMIRPFIDSMMNQMSGSSLLDHSPAAPAAAAAADENSDKPSSDSHHLDLD